MFLLLGLGLKTLQAFLNVSLFLRLQDRPRTWYFSSAFAMIYIVAQRAPSFFITYIFDIQTVCSKHGNRHPCSSLSLPPKSFKRSFHVQSASARLYIIALRVPSLLSRSRISTVYSNMEPGNFISLSFSASSIKISRKCKLQMFLSLRASVSKYIGWHSTSLSFSASKMTS